MQGFALVGAAVLAAFAANGISAVQAQSSLTPAEQAGRLWADMNDCKVEDATAKLVTRKLNDWVRHTKQNDNALTCTRDRDPKSKCQAMDVDIAMGFLCGRVQCDKGPPPAAKPDCNAFLPRFKAMRILRDDWQPKDGLR